MEICMIMESLDNKSGKKKTRMSNFLFPRCPNGYHQKSHLQHKLITKFQMGEHFVKFQNFKAFFPVKILTEEIIFTVEHISPLIFLWFFLRTFPIDLSHKVIKYLININFSFCWWFEERTVVERAGQVDTLVLADHPLVLQVALVAHQDHRNIICVFDPKNLFP